MPESLETLSEEIVACRRCTRLVDHLAMVGRTRKREFASWSYWARPVPGFGDPNARLFVVGLAPAAHGGARTGRAFTGDSSGQFLMRAMHRARFASIPRSETRDDGLRLEDAWIGIAARCAPPDNKPLPEELAACRPFLVRELRALRNLHVILALGRIAWESILRAASDAGWSLPARRVDFAHGSRAQLFRGNSPITLIGSYHPSRQNTNTGRLTESMFDAIFASIRSALADLC